MTAQELCSQARQAASDVTVAARDTAASFERMVRSTVEAQPYRAVFIALALGSALGRMHRRL